MRFDGIDYAALFAAGACQYASEMGMSEKDAEAFAEGICKEAVIGGSKLYDDDEEDTFWKRNKKWLIPTIVGTLAFYAGADGERHGRLDRGYLSNALDQVGRRMRMLFGLSDDPILNAATKAKGYRGLSPKADIQTNVASLKRFAEDEYKRGGQ